MKLKLLSAVSVASLAAVSVMATDSLTTTTATAPDKAKLSYAVGMRMGLQLMEAGTNVDESVAIQAVTDVLEHKPTMMQESQVLDVLNDARANKGAPKDPIKFSYAGGMRAAYLIERSGVDVDPATVVQAMQDVAQGKPKMKQSEIAPLFIQAAKYSAVEKQVTNKAEGAAFLAKNVKNPGIKVMPDGLQYEVVQDGAGPFAKPDDLIYIQFRGTFINGVEFDQHPHFLTRTQNGLKAWSDVLPKMRVGSEWRIYAPPDLAFGHRGESFHGVGPDTTVIYDIKLLSIAPPGGNYETSSGVGHGLDIGASAPDSKSAQ
ncbi:MAG TPA: FKBP-type peptidyl-prolyl cis-trans isomerase N-terminal domain-containing protein [Alphaproteobacteria bacterium]|nr:FKBP-type peptidyl-prolyl cis-trans isomerase N-terminal domain-containing protein [Alphaproteobacteria bacterium]